MTRFQKEVIDRLHVLFQRLERIEDALTREPQARCGWCGRPSRLDHPAAEQFRPDFAHFRVMTRCGGCGVMTELRND